MAVMEATRVITGPTVADTGVRPGSDPQMRTHQWAMSDAEFSGVLRTLALRYHKWDMNLQGVCRILPESIVLSAQAHEHIVRVTEAFADAARDFESRTRRNPGVVKALGIDSKLLPFLAAEGAEEPSFCRADFFLTDDGRWVISEFNEDVPGGFNESVGVLETVGEQTLGGRAVGDLKASLVNAFSRCDGIGFVFATAFSEDLQHVSLLERWLMEAGHETVLASPDQLEWRRGPRLAGVPIEGAFRFYPGEWMALLSNGDTWLRALPRLQMMNPPVRLMSQSKRSFGVWQSLRPLEPRWAGLVADYLPQTELMDAGRESRYVTDRERWVLKRAFGRMGDSVLIGALASETDWAAAVRFAADNSNSYAMQERFSVQPLMFERGPMYPTIGAYAVNGKFAGYYSRVSAEPFINHEAYYVATTVEAAW